MITLKSPHEIEAMRRAGRLTSAARALAGAMIRPGITTQEIDRAVHDFICAQGAVPSFLNYNGFPASVCASVNDEVIHGIPGKRVLQEISSASTWARSLADTTATAAPPSPAGRSPKKRSA